MIMNSKIFKFHNFIKESKIVPEKVGDNLISIKWLDETNEVREFDLLIKNGEAVIIGYVKSDYSIKGYDYIKKSIDYILDLGYNVVSSVVDQKR